MAPDNGNARTAALVAEIADWLARLEGANWATKMWVTGPEVGLEFDHPLSAMHMLQLNCARPNARERFRDLTVRWEHEIAAVAAFGQLSERVAPIGAIRRVAFTYSWTPDALSALTHALAVNGLLTPNEADWLNQAGLPWAIAE